MHKQGVKAAREEERAVADRLASSYAHKVEGLWWLVGVQRRVAADAAKYAEASREAHKALVDDLRDLGGDDGFADREPEFREAPRDRLRRIFRTRAREVASRCSVARVANDYGLVRDADGLLFRAVKERGHLRWARDALGRDAAFAGRCVARVRRRVDAAEDAARRADETKKAAGDALATAVAQASAKGASDLDRAVSGFAASRAACAALVDDARRRALAREADLDDETRKDIDDARAAAAATVLGRDAANAACAAVRAALVRATGGKAARELAAAKRDAAEAREAAARAAEALEEHEAAAEAAAAAAARDLTAAQTKIAQQRSVVNDCARQIDRMKAKAEKLAADLEAAGLGKAAADATASAALRVADRAERAAAAAAAEA